ncbi:MAG: glycoside hydrolase family 10 protein [Stackebrandtia sp.]
MKRFIRPLAGAISLAAALAIGAFVLTGPATAEDQPKEEVDTVGTTDMRGVWIASVANIDWPSQTGLSADEQKAELETLLDQAVSNKLNSVFLQIRPTADAFWPSPHEPWSHWLTGTQGEDPGYDPLEFAVAAAHERGLELHGWFNPYRVAQHTDPDQLDPEHPARVHPEWTFNYNGTMYYNPGIPEVREFVETAIMHAAENYEIDGVHFDDYFYPYPAEGQSIPDEATYDEYGGDFDNIEDWRRNNVDLLVKEIGEKVDALDREVSFGISPFGIWRNKSTDSNGSDTSGLESYDSLYADTRKWVLEGYIDYIAPQVYWYVGHSAADYAALVPWWSSVIEAAGNDVKLYIGQAAYRINEEDGYDDATLTEHLTFNKDHPQVSGDIYFSAKSLTTNAEEAMARVVQDHYSG